MPSKFQGCGLRKLIEKLHGPSHPTTVQHSGFLVSPGCDRAAGQYDQEDRATDESSHTTAIHSHIHRPNEKMHEGDIHVPPNDSNTVTALRPARWRLRFINETPPSAGLS